jgi:hypothetical protein
MKFLIWVLTAVCLYTPAVFASSNLSVQTSPFSFQDMLPVLTDSESAAFGIRIADGDA